MQVWVPSKTVLSENSLMAIHIQNIFISAVFKKDCVWRLTTLYSIYGLFITQKKACCGITKHFIFHQKWDRWCTLIVKQPLSLFISSFQLIDSTTCRMWWWMALTIHCSFKTHAMQCHSPNMKHVFFFFFFFFFCFFFVLLHPTDEQFPSHSFLCG